MAKNCPPGLVERAGMCARPSDKLFRVWWGDENDRREIARISAPDLELALSAAKKKFVKPSALKNATEDGDDQMAFLQWFPESEDDDSGGEYMQVEELEEPSADDRSFHTIYGTNEYFKVSPRGRVTGSPDDYPEIARLARGGKMQAAIDKSLQSGPMKLDDY